MDTALVVAVDTLVDTKGVVAVVTKGVVAEGVVAEGVVAEGVVAKGVVAVVTKEVVAV